MMGPNGPERRLNGMVKELRQSEKMTVSQGLVKSTTEERSTIDERSAKRMNPTQVTAEPGKQEIVIIREFDAPRDLVFRAYTDPTLYDKWIGPRGYTTKIDTFVSKNGGSWRYIQTDKDGNTYGFHGVNHEVKTPERIIQTFEYEGLPESGHVILQAAYFDELPGNRTKVTSKAVFLSVEDRDGMMQSDMEEGMKDSFSRLDELLERLQKK
jgi:uncharacterized protein YndB with AHSA1/START domain